MRRRARPRTGESPPGAELFDARRVRDVSITPEVIEELVDGVDAELEPFDLVRIFEQRDDVLMSLLKLKDKHDQLP
jgi:hypothetical protein